jgi:hypothetical protein
MWESHTKVPVYWTIWPLQLYDYPVWNIWRRHLKHAAWPQGANGHLLVHQVNRVALSVGSDGVISWNRWQPFAVLVPQ